MFVMQTDLFCTLHSILDFTYIFVDVILNGQTLKVYLCDAPSVGFDKFGHAPTMPVPRGVAPAP